MANVKASDGEIGSANRASGAHAQIAGGHPAQSVQGRSPGSRVAAANNSGQPPMAATINGVNSGVHLAPRMEDLDFGFIKPGMLAVLLRDAQEGGRPPEGIGGVSRSTLCAGANRSRNRCEARRRRRTAGFMMRSNFVIRYAGNMPYE